MTPVRIENPGGRHLGRKQHNQYQTPITYQASLSHRHFTALSI
jgi:hypothetical protein